MKMSNTMNKYPDTLGVVHYEEPDLLQPAGAAQALCGIFHDAESRGAYVDSVPSCAGCLDIAEARSREAALEFWESWDEPEDDRALQDGLVHHNG